MSDEDQDSRYRFELLLLDYEMARDDERSSAGVQATMFGIAIAILAILIPLLSQTCVFNSVQGCAPIPVWIIASAPMAPLGTVGYLVTIGTAQTVRNYYLRAVEIELQSFARDDLSTLPIPPASLIRITTELISLRRGRGTYRALYFFILCATTVVFGGIALFIVTRLPPLPATVSAVVYAPTLVLIVVESLRASVGGRGLFLGAVKSYLLHRGYFPTRLPPDPPKGRSLAGYLLLPRPMDVIKWPVMPLAFGYGTLVGHHPVGLISLARAAVVFVCLEYLLYEARYQWNDIRGLADDLGHPTPKGRLPVGADATDAGRNVLISQTVIAIRLVLIVALVIGYGHDVGPTVLFASMTVTLSAISYEWLRSRPHSSGEAFQVTGPVAGIWCTVGLGYGIRGAAGLMTAGVPPTSPVTVFAALGLISFGISFVTMTWALDASGHCLSDPTIGACQVHSALMNQPRIAALLPFVGPGPWTPTDAKPGNGGLVGASVRALRHSTRLTMPWNASIVCAGALAGALGGSALEASHRVPSWLFTVACAVLAGLSTWFAVRFVDSIRRWIAASVLIGSMFGMAWMVIGADLIALLLPWVFFLGVYGWFRAQSWESLQVGIKPVIDLCRHMARVVILAFVGERTARLLAQSSHRSSTFG